MKRVVAVGIISCALMVLVPAAPQEVQSSHQLAVLELLKVMGVERSALAGATVMLDAQIQANGALEPYRDVMLEWAGKYLSWDAMMPELLPMYQEAFTEPELREMTTFYKTPTGQKSVAKMPELMQKGAAMGVRLAQEHLPELEKMVLERKKELEAEKATP